MPGFPGHEENWLVVEPTHLKNIRQIGNLPQIGVNIKNIGNHHLENHPQKRSPAELPVLTFFFFF